MSSCISRTAFGAKHPRCALPEFEREALLPEQSVVGSGKTVGLTWLCVSGLSNVHFAPVTMTSQYIPSRGAPRTSCWLGTPASHCGL